MIAAIYAEYLDPNFDFSLFFLYVQVTYRWCTVLECVCEFNVLYVNYVHMYMCLTPVSALLFFMEVKLGPRQLQTCNGYAEMTDQ